MGVMLVRSLWTVTGSTSTGGHIRIIAGHPQSKKKSTTSCHGDSVNIEPTLIGLRLSAYYLRRDRRSERTERTYAFAHYGGRILGGASIGHAGCGQSRACITRGMLLKKGRREINQRWYAIGSSACFVSHIDSSMSPVSEAKPGKRECNTAKHGHRNERPCSVPGIEDAGQQG
jgi:hypothetical protein